jgi:hypothetical protein
MVLPSRLMATAESSATSDLRKRPARALKGGRAGGRPSEAASLYFTAT